MYIVGYKYPEILNLLWVYTQWVYENAINTSHLKFETMHV